MQLVPIIEPWKEEHETTEYLEEIQHDPAKIHITNQYAINEEEEFIIQFIKVVWWIMLSSRFLCFDNLGEAFYLAIVLNIFPRLFLI